MGTRGKLTWTAADLRSRAKARLDAEADGSRAGADALGMAQAFRIQRIVRRGGQVWGRGEVDRGARFSFTLPEWP